MYNFKTYGTPNLVKTLLYYILLILLRIKLRIIDYFCYRSKHRMIDVRVQQELPLPALNLNL